VGWLRLLSDHPLIKMGIGLASGIAEPDRVSAYHAELPATGAPTDAALEIKIALLRCLMRISPAEAAEDRTARRGGRRPHRTKFQEEETP
jgi:hypothetical protein